MDYCEVTSKDGKYESKDVIYCIKKEKKKRKINLCVEIKITFYAMTKCKQYCNKK